MKGHIRERSAGKWAIVLDIVEPTGTRKRKWHSFSGNKRQAQTECARLVSELQAGNYVQQTKTTVAQFLDLWLADIKSRISPRTIERYTEIVHKNINPLIGTVHLSKLRPAHISAAYAKALGSSGRCDGKGGLSPGTVIYMHRIIKQALATAVRWDHLARNPADAVDPPKCERTPMSTYNMPQTAELLESLRGSRLFVPVLLAVLCGLRRGEIVALRWRNVDTAGAQLSITESAEQTKAGVRIKQPKSGHGRSVAVSNFVIEELRAQRLRQAEEMFRLGVRVNDLSFVYSREDGEPIQPRSLSILWAEMLRNHPTLPRIRFHDLRHAHATHLLASGVHPKVASERLGHSKVGITLDLYSHVLPGMQADAAARVDDALQKALDKRGR